MPGNSFGQAFCVTTFGESHGGCVGAVVDGCPAGLELAVEDIQLELNRRRPGQSSITSERLEEDRIEILSGVFEGSTTGAPILLLAHNRDARSQDYEALRGVLRPSHADYTYLAKYGRRDWRGGGRSSARETLARVAAGAIAKKFLGEKLGVELISYVEQVGDIKLGVDFSRVSREQIEANAVRCPDPETAQEMIDLIEQLRDEGDSVGGILCGCIRGLPAGLGEPVFDKFAADLGKAMLSINAVKGFEFGSGFAGATMRGSEHNDQFYSNTEQGIRTLSNFSGGTQGGITNGEDVYFRVAMKPVSTIVKRQKTLTQAGKEVEFQGEGRHDPCVLPRAVPIVDAMAALVVMDHYLRHRGQNGR